MWVIESLKAKRVVSNSFSLVCSDLVSRGLDISHVAHVCVI